MARNLESFTRALARSLKLTPGELLDSFGPANEDDVEPISALRRRVFGGAIGANDADYLRWRYFSRDPDSSTLLCLKLNGEIVAAIGTEPSEVAYGDSSVECVKCADAIVAPEFDGRGIGAWINLVQTHQHDLVIVIGGNESSLSLLKKLFVSLPVRQIYKCPVRPAALLRRRPGMKLLGMIAPAVDYGWLLIKRWRLRSAFRSTNHEFRRFANIEEMVAHMPSEARHNGTKSLLRTRTYLLWRYASEPDRRYRIYGVLRNDVLSTFLIAKIGILDQAHSRVGMILDWQFAEENESGRDELRQALAGACLDMTEENITLLQAVLNDPASINELRKLGFLHRGTDARFFVKTDNPALQALASPDGWFVTHGDSDGV